MLSEFIKKWGAKKLFLSCCDIACTVTGVMLSLYFTADTKFSAYFSDTVLFEKLLIFIFGAILILPIFRYYQLYKHKYFLKGGEQTLLILKGLLINSIIIIILIFLFKTQEALHDSRTQVIIYFTVSFSMMFLLRVLIFRHAMRANYIGENINKFLTRRAIAVGAGILGQFFAEILFVKPYYHIDLIGFLDDDEKKVGKKINRVKVLGTTNELDKIIEEQEID